MAQRMTQRSTSHLLPTHVSSVAVGALPKRMDLWTRDRDGSRAAVERPIQRQDKLER